MDLLDYAENQKNKQLKKSVNLMCFFFKSSHIPEVDCGISGSVSPNELKIIQISSEKSK